MENLIATIMAVGLISLLAVMGVIAGTDAALSFQARLDASKIVADAETIATAWKSFARNNNGDPALTGYCWGSSGATDLVTTYLSRLPAPPKGSADSTVNYYYPALVANYGVNGATTKVGPTKTPADSIALQLKSARTCLAIAKLGGYSTATSIAAMSGDLTASSTRKPYDCLYVDSDSSGGPTEGDTMLFIYRVFDQNSFTTAARTACP